MNIPSHDNTKELLRPLFRQTENLINQQILIASALGLLRNKKLKHINSYIKEINKPLKNIGMSVSFDTVPSFEDGTPNGVLEKGFFYLEDDGFIILNRECTDYFHPEARFSKLVAFLAEADKFIESKEMTLILEADLPKRNTETSQGKI